MFRRLEADCQITLGKLGDGLLKVGDGGQRAAQRVPAEQSGDDEDQEQDRDGNLDVAHQAIVEQHEVEFEPDKADQFHRTARFGIFRIEIEQPVAGDGFRPHRRVDLERARVEDAALHQVRLLGADQRRDGLQHVFRHGRLDPGVDVPVGNREQHRAVPLEIGDLPDLGIFLDKTLEAKYHLVVVRQIKRRAEFVELLGPLQCPAAVLVLQHPLPAPVQTRDRERTDDRRDQDLKREDFVDQDAFPAPEPGPFRQVRC